MSGFCGWCGQDWDGVVQHKCDPVRLAEAAVKAWMGMTAEQREVEELERIYKKVTPQ